MSVGSFLLVVFLTVVGVWLFRTFRKVRRLYRMVFYGEMPQEPNKKRARRSAGQQHASRQKAKGKVFTAQDGEYVEFEEIKESSSDTIHASYSSFTAEEQVEDAEWEDIKS